MMLLDRLLGKQKTKDVTQTISVTPQTYPDTCQTTRQPTESHIFAPESALEDVSYQWTQFMDEKDIAFFSISTGNRPVFEANCDFAHLRIRNCLNGSRDGWMQSQYPQDYFEPREITLEERDVQRLLDFFKNCNFSEWKTPEHCKPANSVQTARTYSPPPYPPLTDSRWTAYRHHHTKPPRKRYQY